MTSPFRARQRFLNWLLRGAKMPPFSVGKNSIRVGSSTGADLIRWTGSQAALAAGDIGMNITSGSPQAFIRGANVDMAFRVQVIATNASAQTFVSSVGATVTNWTEGLDTATAFNPTTGIFTAPATGIYLVCATLLYIPSVAPSLGSTYQTQIRVNGVVTIYGETSAQTTVTAADQAPVACGIVSVASGGTISIVGLQSGGADASLLADANANTLSILQVG
jgi:hypothetical protein